MDWSLNARASASDLSNHIPGVHHFTHKASLAQRALKRNWPFFAPGCVHAKDCKIAAGRAQQISTSPRWVTKSIHHKHIKLLTHSELSKTANSLVPAESKTLTQMLVESPLLIDQTKFDLGLYVLLRPEKNKLSVEAFEDILVRACRKPYDSDDFSDPETWVVGAKYKQPHELPSLSPLLMHSNTSESAIRAYLQLQGLDPNDVWSQMHQIVTTVVQSSTPDMLLNGKVFELVRFDFVVGSLGKVWLIEANQSPNMVPKTPRQRARLQRVVEETTCRMLAPEQSSAYMHQIALMNMPAARSKQTQKSSTSAFEAAAYPSPRCSAFGRCTLTTLPHDSLDSHIPCLQIQRNGTHKRQVGTPDSY